MQFLPMARTAASSTVCSKLNSIYVEMDCNGIFSVTTTLTLVMAVIVVSTKPILVSFYLSLFEEVMKHVHMS